MRKHLNMPDMHPLCKTHQKNDLYVKCTKRIHKYLRHETVKCEGQFWKITKWRNHTK